MSINKTIARIVEVPLEEVQSKDYAKNEKAGGNRNPCLICGKEITGAHKNVQLLTNGNIVSSDQSFTNSQGFFPVGLNCARKLVITFVW